MSSWIVVKLPPTAPSSPLGPDYRLPPSCDERLVLSYDRWDVREDFKQKLSYNYDHVNFVLIETNCVLLIPSAKQPTPLAAAMPLNDNVLPDGYGIDRDVTAATATALTISSGRQPRERSLTGLSRPERSGPMALALARRSVSL